VFKSGYTVDIISHYSGTGSVTYQIDTGPEYSMTQITDTDCYYATWNVAYAPSEHTVTVRFYDIITYTDKVTVQVVTDWEAELFLEVDWIEGCYPYGLSYLQSYWMSRAVLLYYHIDPSITEAEAEPWIGLNSDEGRNITYTEYWQIEEDYNDHQWSSLTIDDRANGNKANGIFNSTEKWILFGPRYGAYGKCSFTLSCFDPEYGAYNGDRSGEALYGNYMMVASEWITQKEIELGIEQHGGIITVLMHEFGHCIGILNVEYAMGPRGEPLGWFELYANWVFPCDEYCVMASFKEVPQKALLYNHWYYSREYWAIRYLEVY
jgi:hypothetical protein